MFGQRIKLGWNVRVSSLSSLATVPFPPAVVGVTAETVVSGPTRGHTDWYEFQRRPEGVCQSFTLTGWGERGHGRPSTASSERRRPVSRLPPTRPLRRCRRTTRPWRPQPQRLRRQPSP